MKVVAVDHVVTRDQVIWGFGPDLEPVVTSDVTAELIEITYVSVLARQ